jgi:enoyl-CoA hydratase
MFEHIEDVEFEVRKTYATLTLNRPEQLNALTPKLIEGAIEITEFVASQVDVRVLVIQGKGERAFSAGVDLHAVKEPGYHKPTFSAAARRLARTWETMPQATIAKVRGYCFTGALELALACDFIICSEDAQFSDTHSKLGFVPGWGMVGRLPRRVGVPRAKELSFTSRRVSGVEAKAIGLVLDAVPAATLEERVEVLAEQITAMSRDSVAAYKTLYRLTQNMTLDEIIDHAATTNYSVGDRSARQASLTSSLGSSPQAQGRNDT